MCNNNAASDRWLRDTNENAELSALVRSRYIVTQLTAKVQNESKLQSQICTVVQYKIFLAVTIFV